jgi:predicted dehydrogenase
MKVVVIGLGSMGKRRIRLMKEMYPEFHICGVDGRQDRRSEAQETFGIETFASLDEVENIDCAFVCTSPLAHSAIITECLTRGWNVFTEMNLVSDGYEKNMALAKEKGCELFLSSTFMYREEIRYIFEKIGHGGRWNYVYHIGQYLPDWHPWESYKDFFIGDRKTNGCREILAIELPWLVHAFGEVTESRAVSDKITDLNIDFDDNYMIQLTHENGNKGALIVDVVSPCAVRRFEAYTQNDYIQWNGTPETLAQLGENGQAVAVQLKEQAEHREGYRAFVVENAYKNEIRKFFDIINGGERAEYGFEQDLKVLRLIDKIEGN